jgi:threonine dehydratase
MKRIDPTFLYTPQFLSEPLSRQLGLRVILKVETANPIGCFKGRGAELFVSQLDAQPRELVCASAGNFGQALAYAARKRAIPVVVFAAKTANVRKIHSMQALGARVVQFGVDYDAAKSAAVDYASNSDARFVEDGQEAAIAEGAGTIALELCRRGTAVDYVLVPLGGGALLAGIGSWFKERSPSTRLIGVCATGAPAMADSWKAGRLCTTQSVSTIADGIAIRVPISAALDDVRSVVDDVVLVDDEALLRAMRTVFDYHRLVVEPAGVAGLAAIIAYAKRFQDGVVATPLCGANLTPEQVREWLFAA